MGEITVVEGMVLSSMPVGEYDKRVVLLTKERGKISAFARGARRMNSPLMGVTQAFAFGSFEVFEGRNSFDLRRADITSFFSEITQDYDAVCYACYFAELADYYGKENLDAAQMLNLLYVTMRALQKKRIANELIRYIYELKMMTINGEYPEMFACSVCGAKEKLTVFSMTHFGMCCDNCAPVSMEEGLRISQTCLYTLQYIISSKLEKLYTFTVSKEVLAELQRVMRRVRGRVIDKKMKALELLESTVSYSNSF